MNDARRNIDPDVTAEFGHEWSTFRQNETEFFPADGVAIFQPYFHIFPRNELPPDSTGIDVGFAFRYSARVLPTSHTLRDAH
jgi:hypothetical protein